MTKKFVGFGEVMLRLSPDGYLRFPQAKSFDVNYTGAEANVAVSLAYMGVPAAVVTKIPDNDIGRCAKRNLSTFDVNTDYMFFGGERLGVYYCEKGASQRPSKVIYDRKHSAIAEASPEDFDWDSIFENASWFHFTGISAALSDNTARICMDACKSAKAHGVTVSCDLNYRKNLWTTEKAQSVLVPMMRYVDVLIANEEDSEKALGIKVGNTDVNSGKLDIEDYKALTHILRETYGFDKVAITLRESISASVNNWSAMLYAGDECYFSKKYNINIVDRVGGGDSFAAGLIFSMMNGWDNQKTVEFAAAASCLKHTIEQDFNLVSVEEVLSLVNGNGSGRVQR